MFLFHFVVSTNMIDRIEQNTEENLWRPGKCKTKIKKKNFSEN